MSLQPLATRRVSKEDILAGESPGLFWTVDEPTGLTKQASTEEGRSRRTSAEEMFKSLILAGQSPGLFWATPAKGGEDILVPALPARRRCSSTRSCLTKSRRRKHRNGLASGTKYSPVRVLASSGCPLMRADLLRLRKARRRKHPNGLRSGKKSFPANFGCRRSCPRAPLRTFARVHEACGERSK